MCVLVKAGVGEVIPKQPCLSLAAAAASRIRTTDWSATDRLMVGFGCFHLFVLARLLWHSSVAGSFEDSLALGNASLATDRPTWCSALVQLSECELEALLLQGCFGWVLPRCALQGALEHRGAKNRVAVSFQRIPFNGSFTRIPRAIECSACVGVYCLLRQVASLLVGQRRVRPLGDLWAVVVMRH